MVQCDPFERMFFRPWRISGYIAFSKENGIITLFCCMVHIRRKFIIAPPMARTRTDVFYWWECLTDGFAIGHAVFAATGTRESSRWLISEMRKQFILNSEVGGQRTVASH
jgi:hypothetical protein